MAKKWTPPSDAVISEKKESFIPPADAVRS